MSNQVSRRIVISIEKDPVTGEVLGPRVRGVPDDQIDQMESIAPSDDEQVLADMAEKLELYVEGA